MEEECDEKTYQLLEDYPPNSPDLNPIEHLWSKLKIMVQKRKPKNMKDLEEIA